MDKKIYDLELLQSFVKDNKVELIGNYENVNRDTKISGKCSTLECEETFCKSFRMLFNNGGAYCKECTKSNMVKKCKKTCLKNIGVENPMQSEIIKEKIKQTCLEKYNCENPFQNEEIKEKIKQTCLKNIGVEHPMQSEIIKEKIKQTCLEKYNCENPSQNSELSQKQFKNSFNKKEYILPSGKTIQVQGYEDLALDILIYHENIDENDITINRSEVPEIWYDDNGKYHRYYVDIFIKSLNKCIEVKSEYTFNTNKKINLLKHKYVKYNRYNSEIWIFDNKKTLINVIQ